MDALEKKIDDGIGKLDASIKAMKEESDAKFEETAPSQSTRGSCSSNYQADPSTAIGKNQRSDFIELEDSSSKPVQGKLDHMNDDRNRQRTSFGSEFEATGFEQPTGFRQPTGFGHFGQPTGFGQPTTRVERETHNKYEHRMRKLKMSLFDGEDAYGWIYRVGRYFEIQELPQQEQLRASALCMEGEALSWYRWSEGRTPFHSWDGFKRRLAFFQPDLSGISLVMNPEGLNHAMELAVSIEDNELYEGVMQSKGVAAIVGQTTSKGGNFRRMTESELKDRRAKGLCFRCEEKYTPGHRCASSTLQVLLVDESDEAEERDLNFKSWNRGSKID
ncbi:hypothetical protein Tco_0059824 [Tanacetum coccineum]